mgnify:CR=1 FL=1
MNGNGTNPHNLTPGAEPDWSPNGLQIVYRCSTDICLINAAGGAVTPLTTLPSLEFSPAWGPRPDFFITGTALSLEASRWVMRLDLDCRCGDRP